MKSFSTVVVVAMLLSVASFAQTKNPTYSTLTVVMDTLHAVDDDLNLKLNYFTTTCNAKAASYIQNDYLSPVKNHFSLSDDALKPVANQVFIRDIRFATGHPGAGSFPGQLPSVSANCAIDIQYENGLLKISKKYETGLEEGKNQDEISSACEAKAQDFYQVNKGTILNVETTVRRIGHGLFKRPTYVCDLSYLEVSI